MATAPFARRLLAWYDRNRRDLPWRHTRDPWAIWVSEVMLQQTRVEAVRTRYQEFLRRYPTPATLASATDDELQTAWRGLGYYRRARLLRDGARAVCDRHDGRVPTSAAELGDLPGIGTYTAGAVASIAFDRPELAIDGNVERVAARHRALRQDIRSAAARRAVRAAVAEWQDRRRPGDFNQALMELGALVCSPGPAPDCAGCPVARDCRGRALGIADQLPSRPPPPPPVQVQARVVWLPAENGTTLAWRIPDGTVNAGQVELPGPGLLTHVTDPGALAATLRQQFGAEVRVGAPLVSVRHAITRHRIHLTVHAGTARRRGALLAAAPDDPAVPWTTAARKVFTALARRGHGEP